MTGPCQFGRIHETTIHVAVTTVQAHSARCLFASILRGRIGLDADGDSHILGSMVAGEIDSRVTQSVVIRMLRLRADWGLVFVSVVRVRVRLAHRRYVQ